MKLTVISIVIGALGAILQGMVKGLEDLEIRDQVEISQNIITWTPVKNQLTPVWKRNKDNINSKTRRQNLAMAWIDY